ncbi:MAG: hypothetical protein ACMUIL_03585 [bacterium]
MKRATLYLMFLPLILVIIGCGGGEGGGEEDDSGGGWVTIEEPTTEPATSTNCDSIYIGGEAFISPTWYRCCSGSAEDTGVTVTWRNITSGEGGNADQDVDICYFFGSPYLCNHRWGATIPLTLGENQITVTASDPSGVSGQGSITVSKPVASFSIHGKVTNTLDIGLWNSGISGFKLTLTGTDRNDSVFADRYGPAQMHRQPVLQTKMHTTSLQYRMVHIPLRPLTVTGWTAIPLRLQPEMSPSTMQTLRGKIL